MKIPDKYLPGNTKFFKEKNKVKYIHRFKCDKLFPELENIFF